MAIKEGDTVDCVVADSFFSPGYYAFQSPKLGERYLVTGVCADGVCLNIEGLPIYDKETNKPTTLKGWNDRRFRKVDLEKEGPIKGEVRFELRHI